MLQDLSYVLPLAGLLISLAAHLIFYYLSYTQDSIFTGLMKKQEDLLVDSIVVLGGIQITYFFSRLSHTLPGKEAPVLNGLTNTVGFTLLGLFAYVSFRLIKTMEKISEDYTVDVGGEDR